MFLRRNTHSRGGRVMSASVSGSEVIGSNPDTSSMLFFHTHLVALWCIRKQSWRDSCRHIQCTATYIRRKTVQCSVRNEDDDDRSCSPAKHCSLDSAPTWLHGQARSTVVSRYHRVYVQCIHDWRRAFSLMILKHAIVQPKLKKSTLDPAELSSYRSISNLSFIWKTVERVVAASFSEHVWTERLLPSH